MDDSQTFDLDAWVTDTMPALLDQESDADTWRAGFSAERDVRQPVTALLDQGSPLQVFLRSDEQPPEGASRSERTAFYEQREAAQAAAVQAAQDAQQDHAHWLQLQQGRRTADALDSLMSRAVAAQEEREKGATRIPVRGSDQSAQVGRW